MRSGNGNAGGKLQRKLYCKAKAGPAFRFYMLHDKICREDILRHANGLARANAGAPGVDGVSFEQIEERVWKRGWQACARNWSRKRTGLIMPTTSSSSAAVARPRR